MGCTGGLSVKACLPLFIDNEYVILNAMKIIHLTDRLAIIDPSTLSKRKPKAFGLRKNLLDIKELVCETCSSNKNVEAHHIKPAIYNKTSKGNYFQSKETDHSTSNGVFLCRQCHRKLHNSK